MLQFQRKETLEMECANQREEHGGEANSQPSRVCIKPHGEESSGFGVISCLKPSIKLNFLNALGKKERFHAPMSN